MLDARTNVPISSARLPTLFKQPPPQAPCDELNF